MFRKFDFSTKNEILLYSNFYFLLLFLLFISFMEGTKIEKGSVRDKGEDIKSSQSFNNKILTEKLKDTIQVFLMFYDTFNSLTLKVRNAN